MRIARIAALLLLLSGITGAATDIRKSAITRVRTALVSAGRLRTISPVTR